MAICPFATFDQISGGLGAYVAGPFRIVHHTTEGSTYAGARAAFAAHKSDPHFTVAGKQIFQHIDTAQTARALRNLSGGVETNRASAVQIEVVGFAGRPKDAATLKSVARVCRWIEQQHGVAQRWPNGPPRPSINGNDPGGHNRSAANWVAQGGHYGHSQVPENTHWDPAYTAAELAIVTPGAQLDPHEALGMAVVPRLAEESAAQGTADEIAERVLLRLSQSGAFARLTVRVVVGAVQVEVTAERDATSRKGLTRARRRSSARARARRGGSRGRGR